MSLMRFTDLEAWRLAVDAAVSIYQKTAHSPREEKFGLSLQMRRAAASIGANIAEGFGKWAPRDQARAYEIAKGSTEEIRHFLILSERLGFLKEDPALNQTLDFVCGKIVNLRKSALARLKKWRVSSSPRREGKGGTVCLRPLSFVPIFSGCTG